MEGEKQQEEKEEEEEVEEEDEEKAPTGRGGLHSISISPSYSTALLHPIISHLQPGQVLRFRRGKQAEQQRWLRRAQHASTAVKQAARQQKDGN